MEKKHAHMKGQMCQVKKRGYDTRTDGIKIMLS